MPKTGFRVSLFWRMVSIGADNRTIINLRAEDNSEAPLVENLGMKYVWIPIPKVRPWSQISDNAIQQYFEVVNNPHNYPIFFHCRRGADRTGFLAAAYRISAQK